MPEQDDHKKDQHSGRFRRLGRRLMAELDEERLPPPKEHSAKEHNAKEAPRPEPKEEHKHSTRRSFSMDALNTLWEGGDRAKTEVVRAIAREVRNYVDELGLKEDVHSLITNYAVEFHATVHLRRLVPPETDAPAKAPAAAAVPEKEPSETEPQSP